MGTLAQPLREDPVGHNRFHAPTDSIIKTSEPAARLGAQSRLIAGKGSIEGFFAYWPEKKVGGRFKLTCDDLLGYANEGHFQTDDEGQVAVEPETGLYDVVALKLARWIKGLPGS